MEVAGTLTTVLLRRVRDPQGAIHSRAFARSMLSQAQRIVNTALAAVTGSATLTTEPYRQLYPVFSNFPNATKLLAVYDGVRDLGEVPWETLGYTDRAWFRAVGPQFETWSLVGRDLLVLHPALAVASTVTVDYTTLTADLVNDNTATELPDEFLPLVLDVAEAILLLRSRNVVEAARVVESLNARLNTAVVGAH